jgi:hypothetical protein
MATANKTTEPVLVQVNDEVIELKGADLKSWEEERTQFRLKADQRKTEEETKRALKVSAYTKLGLTEEEINSIL